MATTTIRNRIDDEITKKVGKWFTVRELQDRLHINPTTLKPLIMRYARENLLRRRRVPGTPRAVQFSPAASSVNGFKDLLARNLPYRNLRSGAKKRAPTKDGGKTRAKSNSRSAQGKRSARSRR